jgi:putative nucleotidyltransferase with HDIG domain
VPRAIKLKLPQQLRSLLSELDAFFNDRGVEAYGTGGLVRDLLRRAPVHDLDISIAGDPLGIGPELGERLGGSYFTLDDDRRHARILIADHHLHIDLIPLRGDIDADLRARDYTVDAIAASLAELASGRVAPIDPTSGLSDLRAGVIRVVREQALLDDPLRLLRGVRLATQLDFPIEPLTSSLIQRHAPLLSDAPVERQRDELMLIFTTQRAAQGLRLMDALELLRFALPELDVTRDVEQPKEHHFDVFGHSLAAVGALDMLLSESEPVDELTASLWRELWSSLDWWGDARDYLREEVVQGIPRAAVLKLATLLHDIGKPETKSFEESGRMRFFGHADAGAEIAVTAMRRLHFSSREVTLVSSMIRAHLRPLLMAQRGAPSDRAIYRFFRDTPDAGIDTLFLSLADHLATAGPRVNPDGWRRHFTVVNYILLKRFQEPAVVAPPNLLDGDDLMAEFGLPAGPQIGELLELVREAQAAGEITTKEEAWALARRHLRGRTRA